MMDDTALRVDDRIDRRDHQFLEERINDYNYKTTRITDGSDLAILVRDAGGEIVAGLSGWTWGGCMEVAFLWVREDRRSQGHGARLLAAAEQEAIRRGCTVAVLSTHSFQAPAFYQKQGYTIYGTVDGYPKGHQAHYLKKSLR